MGETKEKIGSVLVLAAFMTIMSCFAGGKLRGESPEREISERETAVLEAENGAGDEEPVGRISAIGGQLRWESGFGWQFVPQGMSPNSKEMGYFIRGGSIKSGLEAARSANPGTESGWRYGNVITVRHDMLSEEDFFKRIDAHIGKLAEQYPEEEVSCRINGGAETDQFVQLDVGEAHWLYIRSVGSVYILYGEKMNSEIWQEFLEGWLFTAGLQWNGSAVMKEGGSVANPYEGYKGDGGILIMLQYGEECMEIDGDVLLFHRQDGGFYFKTESEDAEERNIEEVIFRPTDVRLGFAGFEEAVSYFEDRYPDMYRLEANLHGEQTLWHFEEGMLDDVFYRVDEPEGRHGFFLRNGRVCEVASLGDHVGRYNIVTEVQRNLDYDYYDCFSWERREDGSTVYEDNLDGNFAYFLNLGEERYLRIEAEAIGRNEEGELGYSTYRVEISDGKENGFRQEIQVDSTYVHESPFEIEDFNADGYPDLTVVWYYGANGGFAIHYIFSPSRGEFVEFHSELGYYGMYSVDQEARRLYMHHHGSAVDGTEITYQWKNEMDYEMIKKFDHEWRDDGVQVTVIRYEDGKEEVLSDYLYSMEEYEERSGIWGTYYEDFIWEKEVRDRDTGKKYTIRYAEVYMPEEARMNNGVYYDGRIYVYDEDTYLVKVEHSEIIDRSESIGVEWIDFNGERVQALVIRYQSGGYAGYILSGLFQPEYQPARQ